MFEPPKMDLKLEEVALVLDAGFKIGFFKKEKIIYFIEDSNLLLGQAKISQLVINKSISILHKTPANLIISQLQTYYFSYCDNSPTDFILWVIWYLVCKQRLPEMMAFAYSKLITEKEMLERVKGMILEMKASAN
jgi:hypothetical protein